MSEEQVTLENAIADAKSIAAEKAAAVSMTPVEAPAEAPAAEVKADPEKERFNELLMAGVQAAEKGETIYCLQITQEQRLVGDYYLLKRKDAQDFLNYMGGKLKNIGALVIKGKRLNPRVEHKVYL